MSTNTLQFSKPVIIVPQFRESGLRVESTHENRRTVKARQSRARKAHAIARKERVDAVHSGRVYDNALRAKNDGEIKAHIRRLERRIAKLSRRFDNDALIDQLSLEISEARQFLA